MSDALGFLPDTKPDVAEPWRKVLLDAADYIEEHGWRQGNYGCSEGPRCILGAIRSVTRRPFHDQVSVAAVDALSARVSLAVSDWNDAPGRTAAEVTAALRACARQ